MQKEEPEHEAERVKDARFASPAGKTNVPVVVLADIAEQRKSIYLFPRTSLNKIEIKVKNNRDNT